jgi:hypothetical protein
MSSLLSLAPSGVFQRSLLPIEPVRSYHTFSPLPCYGGIFSVALSLGFPLPGITWHYVLAEPGLSSLKKLKRQVIYLALLIYYLDKKVQVNLFFFIDEIFANKQAFPINLAIY